MESAEFLNKDLGKGRIGLEVIELVWVLQKSDNTLEERQQTWLKRGSAKFLTFV